MRKVGDENTAVLLGKQQVSATVQSVSGMRTKVFGTTANATGLTAGARRMVLGTVTNTSTTASAASGAARAALTAKSANASSQGLEKPPQRVPLQNNHNSYSDNMHSSSIPNSSHSHNYHTTSKSKTKSHVHTNYTTSLQSELEDSSNDSDSQSTKVSSGTKQAHSQYLEESVIELTSRHSPLMQYSDDTEIETEDGDEDEDEDLDYEETSEFLTQTEIRQSRIGISPSSTVDADEDDDEDFEDGDISENDIDANADDRVMIMSTPALAIPSYRVTFDCRSACNPEAVCPVWDRESNEEILRLQEEFKNMPGIFDEDDEDTYDISMAAEYSDDIFEYMRELEIRYRPDAGYMERQVEINWYKRGILMDWLVRIHDHCNLLPETLFLTANYIDRFLSLKAVGQAKLQLVGIVALFVAAKYEEITCPSVQEIAYMVDNEYSIDEILRAERYMINLFEFNMGWPGPMSFLRRSSKADDYDSDTRTLAKYLLEITIMDQRFVGAPPSWLAAASHCLSRKILSRGSWSKAHTYFSGYTQAQLTPAVDIMISACRVAQTHHRSIYRKYSDARFKWVSLHVAEWISSNNI